MNPTKGVILEALIAALRDEANQPEPSSAMVDTSDGTDSACIDGWFDLDRVAAAIAEACRDRPALVVTNEGAFDHQTNGYGSAPIKVRWNEPTDV